mgnify:CR=1 FL=1
MKLTFLFVPLCNVSRPRLDRIGSLADEHLISSSCFISFWRSAISDWLMAARNSERRDVPRKVSSSSRFRTRELSVFRIMEARSSSLDSCRATLR